MLGWHREFIQILVVVVLLVGVTFVASRILRSLRHGFSIRLQLFFAILLPSLLTTGMIGLWVIERLEMRVAELNHAESSSVRVLVELLADLAPKIVFLFALLGAGSAAAAYVLGRALGQPLERLSSWAEAIAAGHRQGVLPPPSGREVRRLTDAFESMRRSLEERHAMETFVADLSHELKNPVSAIRAATEVLEEGAIHDSEAAPRFIARIDEASQRLEVMLQDLLNLARLEAAGLPSEHRDIAFDDIVREAIAGQSTALDVANIQVQTNLNGTSIKGDRQWLRRAVDNLLQNALRYTPASSVIQIRSSLEDDFVVLEISDQGPGVSPALRKTLFDRFVTDRHDPHQTGLGLAIVRSVAELHGGDVKLMQSDLGATFKMRIRASEHHRFG